MQVIDENSKEIDQRMIYKNFSFSTAILILSRLTYQTEFIVDGFHAIFSTFKVFEFNKLFPLKSPHAKYMMLNGVEKKQTLIPFLNKI